MTIINFGETPEGLFDTKNCQAAGRSALHVFQTESFDFQLMGCLSQASYSGSEIGECFSTAHLIEDGNNESWLQEWKKTADRVAAIGRSSLDQDHRVSAREAFLRATAYYEGRPLLFHGRAETRAREEALRPRKRVLPVCRCALRHPVRDRRHPFRGPHPSGLFPATRRLWSSSADGHDHQRRRRHGGAVVLQRRRRGGLRRGYNVLCFEGPGRPAPTSRQSLDVSLRLGSPDGSSRRLPLCRPEVDPDRIAYIGYSWGGYLVPRAAAFEKRIAACIADCLLPDI